MILFAEMDTQGWTVIIGAVFVGLLQMLTMILSHRREQAKIVRDEITAKELAELARQNVKTQTEVEKVHVLANSMKDKLVNVTGEARLAEGELKGREAAREERLAETVADKVVEKQNGSHGEITAAHVKKDTEAIREKTDNLPDTIGKIEKAADKIDRAANKK